jgi:hypothetical protein
MGSIGKKAANIQPGETMLTNDRDAQTASQLDPDSLELNKETLGDLDVEPGDAERIRGGAITTSSTGLTTVTDVTLTIGPTGTKR